MDSSLEWSAPRKRPTFFLVLSLSSCKLATEDLGWWGGSLGGALILSGSLRWGPLSAHREGSCGQLSHPSQLGRGEGMSFFQILCVNDYSPGKVLKVCTVWLSCKLTSTSFITSKATSKANLLCTYTFLISEPHCLFDPSPPTCKRVLRSISKIKINKQP